MDQLRSYHHTSSLLLSDDRAREKGNKEAQSMRRERR